MSKNTQKLASNIEDANEQFCNLNDQITESNVAWEEWLKPLYEWSRAEDLNFLKEAPPKLYPNLAKAIFTHPPERLFKTGVVNLMFEEKNQQSRHEMAAWCEKHCTDKYTTFINKCDIYFGFYNKQDASLFRLTWHCENISEDDTMTILQDFHNS